MIIEIKVANYRSINQEQTLSFVAERATRHPDNLIKRPGYRLLKAVGLFGANASGKSNFLKAIGAMSAFVRDSATKMNDGDPILAAEPYRLDPEARNKPSRFEITFLIDGIVYTYGFAATRERIHEEWLTAKQESNDKNVFEIRRDLHEETKLPVYTASGLPVSIKDLLAERTRDNASFLSTASRENVLALRTVYRFFFHTISIFDMAKSPHTARQQTWMQLIENPRAYQQMLSLLRDADLGIDGLQVNYAPDQQTPAIEARYFSEWPNLDEVFDRLFAPNDQQKITVTRLGADGVPMTFDLEKDESIGTYRLFSLIGPLLNALNEGTFLAVDEIDASMHPLLTRKLLEMFQSPEANPNGAQLLFTTHDAVLLDTVLFRRDQIVLAEKCDNASRFYSLADVVPPPRNTEMFFRNYLVGRYGGTPHIGPEFDMIATRSKA